MKPLAWTRKNTVMPSRGASRPARLVPASSVVGGSVRMRASAQKAITAVHPVEHQEDEGVPSPPQHACERHESAHEYKDCRRKKETAGLGRAAASEEEGICGRSLQFEENRPCIDSRLFADCRHVRCPSHRISPMTRFGRRLAADLDREFLRMAREWYHPWHALARGEAVDLDDFRGGRIRLEGMRFDAAAELAYWQATARYARRKIEEAFSLAENHVRARAGFGLEMVAQDTAVQVRRFIERLQRHATFTEYRLRARGYPDEAYLAAHKDSEIPGEIRRRKMAMLTRLGPLPLRRKIAMAAAYLTPRARRPQALMLLGAAMLSLCLARDSGADYLPMPCPYVAACGESAHAYPPSD
jgi:hypothetical protein